MSLLDVDPSLTLAQLEAARAVSTNPFPEVDAQDDIEDTVRGVVAQIPRTPAEAIVQARTFHDHNTNQGVGFCERSVRLDFGLAALWPDAEIDWEESGGKHPETDATKIPRGAVVRYVNGRHGHVVLSVGGGFCWTTDYHRPGFVDLAWMPNLAPWCGGRLVGWSEEFEGVDVWPTAKPKPTPKPFGLGDKELMLRNALARAKKNHASQRRIDGLAKWHDHVEQRIKESAK